MRTRVLVLVALVLVLVPHAAWSQGNPVGPEFRVNTYTGDNQVIASVASDSVNFVVVWNSQGQDGSGYGVFGQRYAASGVPLGGEFRVNTFTTGAQVRAAVAADSAGNFVVVWDSLGQDGSSYGVFGQRYASSGAPLGPEFRVNTSTASAQAYPAVASDASGNFVVAWESLAQDGSDFGVFGQRFASSGAPLGSEFRVNTYTPNTQDDESVASDSSGNFVVVWRSRFQDGSDFGVFGQRFASSGVPLGSEFRVNTYTSNYQTYPSVAADGSGNFVVAWVSFPGQDGDGLGVFGQRYASSGAPTGPEFRVNTFTTQNQYSPSVASDSSGNFVVAWVSPIPGFSNRDIFGQRFASSGTPLGPEFRVNTYTTFVQYKPTVASDAAGNFVVVWQGFNQDDLAYGIVGQRFSQILPVELMHFRVE